MKASTAQGVLDIVLTSCGQFFCREKMKIVNRSLPILNNPKELLWSSIRLMKRGIL